VTTHDLALARIVDSLVPRAMNVHFADHLENDLHLSEIPKSIVSLVNLDDPLFYPT
jgi:hypothetical protein